MYGIVKHLIAQNERRLGVALDYAHKIAQVDFGLMRRYGRIFGFLDPRKHLPPEAYHMARIRGALAADCGTCVEAEMNLARNAGLGEEWIDMALAGRVPEPEQTGGRPDMPPQIAAVMALSDAVTRDRIDAPEAREAVRAAYGESGLIELSFAMNGAALLPGIKRAMGYATACDLGVMRRKAKAESA